MHDGKYDRYIRKTLQYKNESRLRANLRDNEEYIPPARVGNRQQLLTMLDQSIYFDTQAPEPRTSKVLAKSVDLKNKSQLEQTLSQIAALPTVGKPKSQRKATLDTAAERVHEIRRRKQTKRQKQIHQSFNRSM